MKASTAIAIVSFLMAGAVWALEPQPPLPVVRAVWLPEMPLLGPKLAAFQDPGHRMREADPESYCFNPDTSGSQARQRDRDPHAHRCACHLTCQVGAAGEITGDHEDATCAHYCVREACTCHVESPCEMPQ
jgi:hypothetical protein